MKKTQKILGFEQERMKELTTTVTVKGKPKTIRFNIEDALILSWVVNLFNSSTTKKKIIDGAEYVWIKHGYLAECFPALNLNTVTAGERLKKLVALGVLTYKLIKVGGTYSYYGIGENYGKLVAKNNGYGTRQIAGGLGDDAGRVCADNSDGVPYESVDKDNIIKNNIKKYKNENISDADISEAGYTDTLSNNASFNKFVEDFGIIADGKKNAEGLDFDKLYDAYAESANFLQQRPQPKFLSWIVKNYEKIINGYYKDISSKQKGKTASEIWREIYEEDLAEETRRKQGDI